MSDFEDLDFFLESWISEEKRKRKKDPKREKKQKNRTIKNDARVQKKKKKSKDSLEDGKENKKEKKKKKKKSRLEVDEKPEASDQNSEKKTKRKKKVLFDLSPKYIRASRPKLVSSTPRDTRESLQDESQSNSDDINSQDLFITQKTFRTSPEETCSRETSSPADLKQQNISSSSRDLQQDVWKLKTEENELKSNLTEKKPVKLKAVNPFLDDPVLVVEPSKENLCSSKLPSTTNTSTQTENFFTTELSSYLRFCRNVPATDLKPLDLSLPKRKHLDSCLSVIEVKEEEEEQKTPGEGDRDVLLPGSSQQKDVGLKKKCSGRSQTASRLQVRSIDTSSSSEDSEPPGRKLDLNQVRAVQMRLNESFFFKTKGDGGSPRPESPLMKLALGRDVKKKKIR